MQLKAQQKHKLAQHAMPPNFKQRNTSKREKIKRLGAKQASMR
jgi:hypothetical protein